VVCGRLQLASSNQILVALRVAATRNTLNDSAQPHAQADFLSVSNPSRFVSVGPRIPLPSIACAGSYSFFIPVKTG